MINNYKILQYLNIQTCDNKKHLWMMVNSELYDSEDEHLQ